MNSPLCVAVSSPVKWGDGHRTAVRMTRAALVKHSAGCLAQSEWPAGVSRSVLRGKFEGFLKGESRLCGVRQEAGRPLGHQVQVSEDTGVDLRRPWMWGGHGPGGSLALQGGGGS